MQKRVIGSLSTHVPFNAWVYFLIFLVSNAFLSYVPLSLPAKLWVGTFGLFLPFAFAIWTIGEGRLRTKNSNRSLSKLFAPASKGSEQVAWLWLAFIGLLLFTRFYRLTTLPFWPLSDEGIEALLGMNLSHHWSWNLLWTQSRVEPLMYWMLGLYFKLVPPSLFSIRFFPAVLSLLTVYAAYRAAKQFFENSPSLLITWITAFAFWELTLTRLCSLVILVPLFQCFCFEWLGRFRNSQKNGSPWINLLVLTAMAGAGFYTWSNWAGVWLVLLTAVVFHSVTLKPSRPIFILVFVALSAIITLPLVGARLAPGEMNHLRHLSEWDVWKTFPLYLQGLFWNGSGSFPFGPNWGGLLNPILAAMLFIGLLHLIRSQSFLLVGTVFLCLFFSSLPGLLSHGLDLYRILPLFPLLMVLTAAGALSLAPPGKKSWRLGGIMILILGSCFLDGFNYSAHYAQIEKVDPKLQWRNTEYHHAYEILEKFSRESGPMYVFSEFNMDYDNKTLNIACYPFDVLQNHSLPKIVPRWCAVIINARYAPFLIKNFPGLKFGILKTDKQGPKDPAPFGIFLIPVSEIPQDRLGRWIQADLVYRQLNLEIKNNISNDLWKQCSVFLQVRKDQITGDRFLQSFYWEKIAFFNYLEGDFNSAALSYQNAIQQGYPAAHLYYDLGVSLNAAGRGEEGNQAIKKAQAL